MIKTQTFHRGLIATVRTSWGRVRTRWVIKNRWLKLLSWLPVFLAYGIMQCREKFSQDEKTQADIAHAFFSMLAMTFAIRALMDDRTEKGHWIFRSILELALYNFFDELRGCGDVLDWYEPPAAVLTVVLNFAWSRRIWLKQVGKRVMKSMRENIYECFGISASLANHFLHVVGTVPQQDLLVVGTSPTKDLWNIIMGALISGIIGGGGTYLTKMAIDWCKGKCVDAYTNYKNRKLSKA